MNLGIRHKLHVHFYWLQEICRVYILLFNRFQPDSGDEGDGDCGYALDLDNDALIVLDALDDALGILEIAISDANTMAWLLKELVIGVEIEDAIVLDGGHTDEVFHLALGHGEEIVVIAMGEGVGHVAQGLTGLVVHLQLGDLLLGRIDEDEVANGGLEVLMGFSGLIDIATKALHGQEGAHTQTFKGILDTLLATIGDTHGIPEGLLTAGTIGINGGGHYE